ncbi:PREDICTED: uncharacterized protein LOC104783859 [Camelina sativa]|uniref:Uncharacterized protein LOC104783859 n=1 Tax=Camelina sativa TaxID=90675 RepID=A0ABM0YX72_CAMSA|nr:PREDICTED: uncharacterized protein LOC104783859 [Camelina sativa]
MELNLLLEIKERVVGLHVGVENVKNRSDEDDKVEAPVEHDSEDDCAVYGDEDCNDVDDAVGGGNDEANVEEANVEESALEEVANLNIEHDFPEMDDEDEIEEEDKDEAAPKDWSDPESLLAVEKRYNSPEDFKLAVLMYSLKTRYDIKLYRSNAFLVGAKCCYVDENGVLCPWRVYCSYEKRKHKMQIRVYVNEHVCVRSGYSKMLKRSSIAFLFDKRLRVNPKFTKYEMAAEIKREYNLEVTPDQCAKAKTKVMSARKASHESQFARIWDYQAEVLNQNPGSEFEIETAPGPMVGSKQRHVLAAVGRDGDNRIVPLAWTVVEIENDDNWDWLLRHLCASLGLVTMTHLALISDKQSGLVKAISNILPHAEHRQCAKHIMDNWKRDSHDQELQHIFWRIARSYTTGQFNDNMAELKRYNPQAYASLQLTNPITWSRAFFKIGTCCNDNLNNLSDSFNRTIRQARRKPLLDLLEDIRRQCMVRNAKRFIIAEVEDTEVADGWNPMFSCSSVIIGRKEKVEDNVNDYYTKKKWRETYLDGIRLVQGMPLWPRLNRLPVFPPPWRMGNPRRPSNHDRRKGRNESLSSSNTKKMSRAKRIMTCSNCHQEGHNKQACKNPTAVSVPKRPRGRPRKY